MSRQTEALKLALKAMKSFQEGTGNLYEGEFDEEIKTCEEALAQEKALQALHDENERLGLYKDAYAQSMTTQKRPQNCGTSYCSCIECVMEPDYKALWEQMCERCDELDKKLAQPEQEPVAWRNAAIRVGEDLCSVGPFGYYDMTAEQWLDWALSVVTVHAPPPQRTWVGLSVFEINDLVTNTEHGLHELVERTEKLLEEKNT